MGVIGAMKRFIGCYVGFFIGLYNRCVGGTGKLKWKLGFSRDWIMGNQGILVPNIRIRLYALKPPPQTVVYRSYRHYQG